MRPAPGLAALPADEPHEERLLRFLAEMAVLAESLKTAPDKPLLSVAERGIGRSEMPRMKGQTGTNSGKPYKNAITVRLDDEHAAWLKGKRCRGWLYVSEDKTPRFDPANQERMLREAAALGHAKFDGTLYTERRTNDAGTLITSDVPEVADRYLVGREFDALICASTTRLAYRPLYALQLLAKFERIGVPVLFVDDGVFLGVDPDASKRLTNRLNARAAEGAARAASRKANREGLNHA